MKRVELGRRAHGCRTAIPLRRVIATFAHQRRRAFPIGLVAGLVCAALWLGAIGTSAQAQGVSGYVEVTGTAVTVPGFTSATGSATCPAGDVVLSGGYTLVGGNMEIDTSAPLGANGAISSTTWTVTGFDNGDGQGTFTPYAICVSSSIAGYSEASNAQSVNAGSSAQLTETCPAGSVITGGGFGFTAGSTAPVINESDPTSSSNVSSTTWTVFVNNSGSKTAQSVTTYVVCVSNAISGFSEQLAQNSTAGIVSATCPSGSLVIGGGVSAPGPPNTSVDAPVVQNPAGAFVVSSTSWSVDAASTGGGVIGSIAICASPVPTVNSLKPSNGPAAGGSSIAVVGSNFTAATAVNFGSTPATSFSVISSGQINAVVPAGSGAVDVTVTTPGGTSPTVSGDIYKYVPSVTSVSPTSGPTTGGTTVTINGTGFTGATGVSFGGTAATFVVKSSSQISATAPAGAAGTVDITVTTPGGTSATTTNDQYTYVTPPTVTRVSPSSGPAAGGTSVTIAGTNFTGATAVSFGGTAASSFTVTSATSITATSPAGSGAVDVTVTIPGGDTSATNSTDVFKYVPSVTSVSPTSGPTAGGTTVTINGTGFTGATAVSFGGTVASTFTVNGSSKITATSPAESAGTVDITVTTPGGTSASSANDQYTYVAVPTVTSVSPSAGPTGGGTSVTITGTNLTGATAVKFGATNATSFTVNSATSISSTAPAGSAGTVDVTVTTAGGTSATSANDNYRYAAAPTVASVSPTAGPTAGGTSVTISGTNLTGASTVKFGATTATSFTINSATSITATAPAGSAGTVDITVTTPAGTSATSANDNYRYAAAPTVTSVSPTDGPTAGGTSVTITGTNFTGATAVKFGATNATFVIVNATQITATAPAESAGMVDMTVTTPGGTSATGANDQFFYSAPPTVSTISPSAGPLGGGTTVTITGTNLLRATGVEFGATNATFVIVNATQITATAPVESAGTVDITVTTPGGTTATGAGDKFTYAAPPTVTSISPSAGPTAGGTSVTITGTNLSAATGVKFGNNDATNLTGNTATQITATAPAGSAGPVDVTVTTAGGTSTTSNADKFTYAAPPTVTSISPSAGPTAGGTSVTITGTNLANPSAVKFGGSNATVVTPISATKLTAVSPPGSAGAQDVTVTTPGGTSATSSADRFTFVPPPTVTGVSPSSGPAAGGTSVTITGTDFSGATAVSFGATPAASFSFDSPTQITATTPAGSGTADLTVTTPSGTSATNAADRFTYNPSTPPPSSPVVLTGAPSVHGSGAAALEGSVNPQGLPTSAHYDYGLDSQLRASGPIYDQTTPSQNVGSDFSNHTVVGSLSGLVPNALYHVRLVATNSAGNTFGPDATFTTKEDPPPPAPKLGGSFNAQPVKGLVLVEINGKFVPLTEVRQIPNGAIINALHGTLVLITAADGKGRANVSQNAQAKRKNPKAKVTTQKGTFGGAVFKVTQDHSGLATLSLVEGASFPGAPTFASCTTHGGKATVAALSKKTLQLLHGSDNHGKFRTKGRYAAATVRGTVWSIADRCDGTLTHVARGTVVVSDLVRRKTITLRAGHSYLALARPPKHK